MAGYFDLHQLVGVSEDTYDSWDVERQRRRVKERLGFEQYVPDEAPTPEGNTLYNPAIDVYQENHRWEDGGWRPVEDTTPLRTVQEYVPTDEAIELLVERSPILEIAAGNGYLSHVINENGGNAHPTDPRPPDVDAEPPATAIHVHEDEDGERHTFHESLWMEVEERDHRCVTDHPEKDVLMCHPPGANEWTLELLDLLGDQQHLILIAEWFPGADADPEFFRRLHDNWTLEETFPMIDWATMHARGYVFLRN